MMKPTARQSAALLLLAIGILLCWATDALTSHPISSARLSLASQHADDELWIERILILASAVLALWPFTRHHLHRFFEQVAKPSPSQQRWRLLAIALVGGTALYFLGAARGRLLLPIWHDENMYRMQTTFLAHGKLCMNGLPVPDFFDSPYVLVRGVYTPVYFPGTALLHVPAAWLHLPYWLTPLAIATVSLLLLYLIVTELIDALAGLTAILLVASLVTFRWLALVEMSHAAGMMWGLVVLWAWLRWRKGPALGWIALAGAAAGFYAITRPLDALLLLTPVGVAWLLDLRRRAEARPALSVLVAVASAAPLLALQLAFDRAVTGHFLQTPLALYNRVYFHATSLGLQHFDAGFVPPTPVRQIRALYEGFDRPFMAAFTTLRSALAQWGLERIPMTLRETTPSLLLLVLLPPSLLGLTNAPRRVFWSMIVCFLVSAGVFYMFHPQYTIAAAPAVAFAVVLGGRSVQRAWPRGGIAAVFLPLAILLLSAKALFINKQDRFEPIPAVGSKEGWVSRFNYRLIPRQVKKPALVFFRFGVNEDPWEEPVYNWDVLNPDEAAIIRAHDLGPQRDRELLRYYQTKRPDLHVYRFDRQTLKLEDLGTLSSAMGR